MQSFITEVELKGFQRNDSSWLHNVMKSNTGVIVLFLPITKIAIGKANATEYNEARTPESRFSQAKHSIN